MQWSSATPNSEHTQIVRKEEWGEREFDFITLLKLIVIIIILPPFRRSSQKKTIESVRLFTTGVLVSSSSHFNSIKIYCQQSYDDLFMLKWNTYSRAQPVPSRLFDMIAVNWFSMSSECQKWSRLDHFNDYLQSDERFSCFCVYFTDGGFKSIRSMFGCLRLFLWWDQREQIFIVSHDLIIWWWSNRLLLICGLRLLRSSSAEPVGNLLSNMFSELRLVIKKPSNIKWNGHRDKIVISRNSRAHTESPALNSYILLPCPHYHVVFHAIICHLLTLILSCLPWLIMFEHWFGAP